MSQNNPLIEILYSKIEAKLISGNLPSAINIAKFLLKVQNRTCTELNDNNVERLLHPVYLAIIIGSNPEFISKLKNQPNINTRTWNPLICAIKYDRVDLIKTFIDYLPVKTDKDLTALDYAIHYSINDNGLEILDIILQHSKNIDTIDKLLFMLNCKLMNHNLRLSTKDYNTYTAARNLLERAVNNPVDNELESVTSATIQSNATIDTDTRPHSPIEAATHTYMNSVTKERVKGTNCGCCVVM